MWTAQLYRKKKSEGNVNSTFSFIEIEQITFFFFFFNKPFYIKCKILMFDSFYVTGCLLCKQKYHLLLLFYFIFYFKTCSKELNNADPAPKGNRFWKSQYSFKILRLIDDI